MTEIHAIKVPSTELTVDYRPSDGAIIINVAGKEVLCLYPNGFIESTTNNSLKKLYEAIAPIIVALHEWMVSARSKDAREGRVLGSYIGLRYSFTPKEGDSIIEGKKL